jgi:hypothetical protein
VTDGSRGISQSLQANARISALPEISPASLQLPLHTHTHTHTHSGPPRGLRHEPSSPARTLGLWVRIPLIEWMSVRVYSVFVLSCVQVAALRHADPPSKESYRLCID